jgi:hypothetical protein
MLAFEVEGGREAGRAVIDALRLPELTASLGSVHTMVVHPPSTSHRQSSEAELREAGITPGLLRVSVGLEDLEDLRADFEAALATDPGHRLRSIVRPQLSARTPMGWERVIATPRGLRQPRCGQPAPIPGTARRGLWRC